MRGVVGIEMWAFCLKERWLIELVPLAFYCIRRRNYLLQAEQLEVLNKEFGEVGPLGVVARQKNHLVAEGIRVVLQVCVDFLLDVGILGVELVVLGYFRCSETDITVHSVFCFVQYNKANLMKFVGL